MNKSGFNLNLHMDFLNSKATRYCRVIGEKGTLILDLVNNSISFIKPGEKAKILYKEKNLNQNDMYIKLLKNFKEVSLKKAKPEVSLKDSVYITNLIEIMKTSSKNNTMSNIKTYAFIFARGGSKGLKNKNLFSIGGKPLIAHSIEAAQNNKKIHKVFVSSDSNEIKMYQ